MNLLRLTTNLCSALAISLAPALASENETGEYLLISPKTPAAETYAVKVVKRIAAHWQSPNHADYSLNFVPAEYVDLCYQEPDAWHEHVTKPNSVVQLTLRPNGFLSKVSELKSSGDVAFDAAVIEAVKRAAPFGKAGVATTISLTVRAPSSELVDAKLIKQ